MKHMKADTKANGSVYLFFSTVILSRQLYSTAYIAHLVMPDKQTYASQNQKSDVCQRTEKHKFDNFKMRDK